MDLDKKNHYIFCIGSDNQHRLHWDGSHWRYEFLAGGVLFDNQKFDSQEGLAEAIAVHGLTFDQFQTDDTKTGEAYSKKILDKKNRLQAKGFQPCSKHGWMAKNDDNTCEACDNIDYPDDFKGTEG